VIKENINIHFPNFSVHQYQIWKTLVTSMLHKDLSFETKQEKSKHVLIVFMILKMR